jgi:transcriptional antiterminator RfaH
MHWYVIHTKPRQEERALLNLERQGYICYLPVLSTEKLRKGTVAIVQEPLFSRYLFIRLSTGQSGQSWAPIRSTQGVSRLVTFGAVPAKVNPELIEILRDQTNTLGKEPARLFDAGDRVLIKEGPFVGLQAIYQMMDGERRAMVLIEILGKLSKLTLEPATLQKA